MAVSAGVQRRAQKRLAYLRTRNPDGLPGVKDPQHVNLKQAKRIKRRYNVVSAREKRAATKAQKKAGWNPLAPLTGKDLKSELTAATNLEYGDRDRVQKKTEATAAQQVVNTGTYYDDYRRELEAASGRIKAAHDEATAAQLGDVNRAYEQDSARQADLNKQSQDAAAKLGRTAAPSQEGAQSLAAGRTQGLGSVATMREQSLSDSDYQARRGATAVQAKAEALTAAQKRQLGAQEEGKALAKEKGDFKVNFRTKARADERTYAMGKKEFGLKEKELQIKGKQSAADRKIEAQKLRTQKLVANIYASADKSKARAQIRVAKLQLKKGKIDQHQYTTVVNTYHGLPEKGQSGGGSGGAKGGSGKPGVGSGAGGALQPWEKDKVDLAYRSLVSAHATAAERRQMIDNLVKRGQIPARLARVAWQRYDKRVLHGTKRGPQGLPTASGQN